MLPGEDLDRRFGRLATLLAVGPDPTVHAPR
jgi:hypothetical protein